MNISPYFKIVNNRKISVEKSTFNLQDKTVVITEKIRRQLHNNYWYYRKNKKIEIFFIHHFSQVAMHTRNGTHLFINLKSLHNPFRPPALENNYSFSVPRCTNKRLPKMPFLPVNT